MGRRRIGSHAKPVKGGLRARVVVPVASCVPLTNQVKGSSWLGLHATAAKTPLFKTPAPSVAAAWARLVNEDASAKGQWYRRAVARTPDVVETVAWGEGTSTLRTRCRV